MAQDANERQPREGIDIPFGPPPEEYLYRCGVCGEEMLVNEAIIDVVVGAAKFRGEYRGGMPWLTDKTQILYFQAASWYSKTKRDCRRFSSCFLEAMAGSGSGSLLKYTVVMSSQPLLSA